MGLFDIFKKKNSENVQKTNNVQNTTNVHKTSEIKPKNAEVKKPEQDLSEEQLIAVLTQNRIEEFKQDNIRGDAADKLGKFKSPEAVAALMDAAKNDPARNVRGRSLRALGEIAVSGGGTVEVDRKIFFDSLNDSKNYVVKCAAEVFGKLKDKDAIQPMLNIVRAYREGQDISAVQEIIKAFGAMGDDAVPALLEEFENGTSERWVIFQALAGTGSVSALEVFQKSIADKSIPGDERGYVAEGLAKIGTKEAIDTLVSTLESEDDEDVVRTITRCLEKLNVQVDGMEEKKKEAEIKSAKKLLEGLKAVQIGMTEDEADALVGFGNFQMGANVVHNTKFGNFQFVVVGNRVTQILRTNNVIEKIEQWLKEQE